MKITCHSCQSKYTIADDKVLGKVVKIRCKKCGTTIVVNGSDGNADLAPASGIPMSVSAQGLDESWTVSVTEADQRNMTDAEVVAAFRSGIVDSGTFCWKDGMSDWLPLGQIEQLYGLCLKEAKAAPKKVAAERADAKMEPARAAFGVDSNASAQAAPVARLAGGRAPAADLFGGFSRAGGEEEIMTSAPSKMPEAHEANALTGARNENSVLFSLSTLTGKGEA